MEVAMEAAMEAASYLEIPALLVRRLDQEDQPYQDFHPFLGCREGQVDQPRRCCLLGPKK